ncbi:unnamed protein product [Paramecium pentaurelia]|uniref:Uncharacterized protein n=1 Tax=Paramecium pentaurelia TaxID=43138 RepID=A0A8S1U0R2_9CILI|nr:unnamed protein product [Paramecium pentaurelia]
MNIQTQSEIELKLSAFEKLGDNPTEVDIKYVSYLLKIPLQTIRQWLEERAGLDFQIDLSPAEDKECSIIGCVMKKKKLINQQSSVKEEEAQQKQTKNQSIKSSTDTKQNHDIKKKKQNDKIKQIDPNKQAQKSLKKQAKLAAKQAQQFLYEDSKTQEKNILDNQKQKLPFSIQTQKLVQQIDITNKINNIVQNIDNYNQQQQIRKQKKQYKLLSQKKNLIRLDKEKNQKELQLQIEQCKGQQRQCLIVIDDEINQKNQLSTNQNNERIQSNYYKTLNQNKLYSNDKLQLLKDLSYFQDKKIKKPIQQALQEIQFGQNKHSENNLIKQNEQKQNIIQINHQKHNQQSQAIQNINQTQMQNFYLQNNQQQQKLKQQIEKKSFNNQNLNQQSQRQQSNLNNESLKLPQQHLQQQPNYLAQNCNSQSIPTQSNLTNQPNKSSPIQTTPTKFQNQESQLQKQPQIGSESNLIQTQFNQAIQGPITQNNLDKKLQLPNYLVELIQMFNKNTQALGQAVQQITAVSNQQMALMEKLDIIYECVNTK